MTSEIALLNRSAVALAADSAATVSHWEKDHYETRYFKGTNKIFQLSTAHPVGIMIYAAASLQGAPWELLIKSYRDWRHQEEKNGKPPLDELKAYAPELFEYITNNANIFSPDVQEKQFHSDVDIVAARIVISISSQDAYKNAADEAARKIVAVAALADIKAKIDAAKFVGNAIQGDVDVALPAHTTAINEMIDNDPYYTRFKNIIDFAELAKVAITGQYKVRYTNLSNSGLVVAGYGDKDFFPRLVAYRCHGLVLGKLILEEEPNWSQTISQTNGSAFVSFAQDEMIRTFIFGAGANALVQLDKLFAKEMDNFYDSLLSNGLAPDLAGDPAKMAEIDKFKQAAINQFGSNYIEYCTESHARPMRRVLGALPFDEMAELAETLVLLESLKERVTSPSSSVSGPIDVAVISKNDGFIWIKRKHYFDPQLNPRYFSSRAMQRKP